MECREAAALKNAAYKKTLQSATTRAIVENYREKRKEERRFFRYKKGEQERREREEVEMYRCRNDARKFYQKVERLTEGYKPEASSCKDEHGNLVTDPQGVLRLWKKHFSTLLQGDENTNTAFREVPNQIDEYCVEIPPPSHDEIKVAIMRLKNNKAVGPDGLPAELFKTGCNELVGRMHQLIY